MFVIVSGSLGSLIGVFCLLWFILWALKQFGKPHSPTDKQMIWVILFYLVCVYSCFKIFEEDKRIWGWNSYPDGVGVGWRGFAICLLLFGWVIPFIGFGLYNKKQLK